MKRPEGVTVPADLAKLWRRWTAIIELFARRRLARNWVVTEQYSILHHELLEHCRVLAEASAPPGSAFYRSLEEMVQPWLTPYVLAHADQEILQDLLYRSLQAERQLSGRGAWRVAVERWAGPVLTVLLGVGLVAGIAWMGEELWLPVWSRAREWWQVLGYTLKQWAQFQNLLLAGAVAVVVALFLAVRTARS